MLFDTDVAGQSAIVRSLDLLIDEGMNVRVATLAQDEDPDSFIRQYGLEAFASCIDNAQSLLDFKFDWLAAQFDLKTVEGKSKISQELLSTIARYRSEVAKYELTKALAQKLNIPEGVLLKNKRGRVKGPTAGLSFKQPQAEIKHLLQQGAGQRIAAGPIFKRPLAWESVSSAWNISGLKIFPMAW